MPKRRSAGGGTTLTAPLSLRVRNPGKAFDYVDEIFRGCARQRADFIEDFLSPTLLTPSYIRQVGAPSLDQLPNVANGVFRFQASGLNQGEESGVHWGDALLIDSRKAFFAEFLVSLTAIDTNAQSRFFFGLCSAYDIPADNMARNAWFRIEGYQVRCETDDGVTDRDDQPTSVIVVENTYNRFTVNGADLNAIEFYVNDSLVQTLAAPAMTGNLQPIMLMQRDGGNTQTGFFIDYYRVSWDRE